MGTDVYFRAGVQLNADTLETIRTAIKKDKFASTAAEGGYVFLESSLTSVDGDEAAEFFVSHLPQMAGTIEEYEVEGLKDAADEWQFSEPGEKRAVKNTLKLLKNSLKKTNGYIAYSISI